MCERGPRPAPSKGTKRTVIAMAFSACRMHRLQSSQNNPRSCIIFGRTNVRQLQQTAVLAHMPEFQCNCKLALTLSDQQLIEGRDVRPVPNRGINQFLQGHSPWPSRGRFFQLRGATRNVVFSSHQSCTQPWMFVAHFWLTAAGIRHIYKISHSHLNLVQCFFCV